MTEVGAPVPSTPHRVRHSVTATGPCSTDGLLQSQPVEHRHRSTVVTGVDRIGRGAPGADAPSEEHVLQAKLQLEEKRSTFTTPLMILKVLV